MCGFICQVLKVCLFVFVFLFIKIYVFLNIVKNQSEKFSFALCVFIHGNAKHKIFNTVIYASCQSTFSSRFRSNGLNPFSHIIIPPILCFFVTNGVSAVQMLSFGLSVMHLHWQALFRAYVKWHYSSAHRSVPPAAFRPGTHRHAEHLVLHKAL